jgi:hypothetical protein
VEQRLRWNEIVRITVHQQHRRAGARPAFHVFDRAEPGLRQPAAAAAQPVPGRGQVSSEA